MKDILRDNEFDGVGDVAKLRAIGFSEWLHKNHFWQRTAKIGEWFDLENVLKQTEGDIYTTTELYREYLKSLENVDNQNGS